MENILHLWFEYVPSTNVGVLNVIVLRGGNVNKQLDHQGFFLTMGLSAGRGLLRGVHPLALLSPACPKHSSSSTECSMDMYQSPQ